MIALKDGVQRSRSPRVRSRWVHRIRQDRSGLCVALLLVPQPWLAGLLAGAGSVWAGLLGGALIAAGLAALHRIGRAEATHFPMLLLCSTGMIGGLAIDRVAAAPLGLAGLCVPDALDLWQSAARHWSVMPWMHAGMLLITLAALCAALRRGFYRRASFDLACGVIMLASMDAAAWAAGRLGSGLPRAWVVDAAMPLAWAAMMWSVVLLVLLRQAAPTLARHRVAQPPDARPLMM